METLVRKKNLEQNTVYYFYFIWGYFYFSAGYLFYKKITSFFSNEHIKKYKSFCIG